MKFERYYIKTRETRFTNSEADMLGIKSIHNWTSAAEYMPESLIDKWVKGLYNADIGECIIVESILKDISGEQLFVISCIVFHNIENCNLYYLRNYMQYKSNSGFHHLLN